MRRYVVGVAAVTVTVGMTAPAAAGADGGGNQVPECRPVGTATDLGEPVRTVLSPDQAIGEGPDGEPLAFFFPRGNDDIPSEFAVVDIRSGETIFDERVPRGKDGWAVEYSPAEQAVYFGVANGPGDLYRYQVGSNTIEELGVPLDGEQIWALAAAPDGTIYGGTYPNGHVFSYDPDTDEIRDYGQTLDQPYVRSLAVTDDAVWAGTQGVARLAEIDRETGETTEIALPEEYQDRLVVYDLFHVRDDRLIVRTETAPDTEIHVFDLEENTFVDTISEAGARHVSPVDPATDQHVYFRVDEDEHEHDGEIVRYDLETNGYEPTGWAPTIITGDFAWIDMDDPDFPGLSLAVTYYNAEVHVYNPESQQERSFDVDVMGAPARLASIGTGPDDRVYVSSQAGQARWDPNESTLEPLPGGGNTQGYGSWDGDLLLGKYAGGGLQRYDPTEPWDPAADNPTESLRIGERQDRPLAFAELPGRVAVGSAPESGYLGGALTFWNPDTDELDVRRDVVPGQSIVSLVYDGDLIWGGTSINGGYGVDPAADEAELFAYDPASHEVVGTTTIGSDVETITSLVLRDGVLWGNADGTVFAFDIDEREIVGQVELEHDTQQIHGRNRGIAFDDCGQLFAVTANKLYAIDQSKWQARVLEDNQVEGLVVDNAGDLYYRSSGNLFRYRTRVPATERPQS